MRFFNNPDRFSFKDGLAIVFNAFFFYFCWKAQYSDRALEIVKALIWPEVTILLGYFGTEMSNMFASNRMVGGSYGMGGYGGFGNYGYMTATPTMPVATPIESPV